MVICHTTYMCAQGTNSLSFQNLNIPWFGQITFGSHGLSERLKYFLFRDESSATTTFLHMKVKKE